MQKPHGKNTPSFFCKSAPAGSQAPESAQKIFWQKKEELER